MQSTSTLYQNIMSAINHRIEVKVNIGGTDYGINKLISVKTNADALGTNAPTPGLAISKTIELEMLEDSANIPRMSAMIPYVRPVNDTTQGEWIQKGYFYIDTRETDQATDVLTLKGYDSMLKAEAAYPSSNLTWPALDTNVVAEIAQTIGVSVDAKTTALMTAAFAIPFPAQYTMRECLANIAGLYGGCFVISDTNTLLLRCVWDVSDTPEVTRLGNDSAAPSSNKIAIAPAFSACSGIRFIISDTMEVFVGNETGYVFEYECPWATQANGAWLLNKMAGLVYSPYRMEGALIDPAAEIGDSVLVGQRTVSGSSNLGSLPYTARSGTWCGLSFTSQTNGKVKVSGSISNPDTTYASGTVFLQIPTTTVTGEDITVSLEVPSTFPIAMPSQSGTATRFDVDFLDASDNIIASRDFYYASTKSSGEKVLSTTVLGSAVTAVIKKIHLIIYVGAGETNATVLNDVIAPMVCYGSITQDWKVPNGGTENVLSGLWSYEQNYNSLGAAEISANYDEDLDHEFPYIAKAERIYRRRERNVEAILSLYADRLESVVEELEPELKNILPCPYYSTNPMGPTTGVTATFDDDGSVKFTGTSASNAYMMLFSKQMSFSPDKYVISFTAENSSYWSKIHNFIVLVTIGNSSSYYDITSSKTIDGETVYYRAFDWSNVSGTITVYLYVYMKVSTAYNDVVYPQIEVGTQPTKWETNNINILETHESRITQLADSITLKVSKGDISSEISLEEGDINISGNRIAISSTNFNVTKQGVLTASAGTIGDWEILNGTFSYAHNSDEFLLDPANCYMEIKSSQHKVDLDDEGLHYWYINGNNITKVGDLNVKIDSSYCDFDVELYNNSHFLIENNGSKYFEIDPQLGNAYFFKPLIIQDNDLEVWQGDLYVSGQKNRVVGTKSYGNRLLYAFETPSPCFGDIGEAEIDEDGICRVDIDPIFAETIDLGSEYQVFLQKEGPGDLWVETKNADHFIVKGTENLKFSWELKAKQIDWNGKRLEPYEKKE